MTREEHRALRKKTNVEFVNKLKESSPCTDCGEYYPFYVMEYDHLDGATKKEIISQMCRHSGSEAITAEIAKCELVCANCHAKRTYKRSHS